MKLMSLLEGLVAGILAHRAIDTAGKARQKAAKFQRKQRISEELGPIATEFHDTLGDRILNQAKETDNVELYSLASSWDVIAEQIDASVVIFEQEDEAIDWLIDEIVAHDDVDLTDESQAELRQLLAEEYAKAVAEFRDRVASDEQLQYRIQEQFQLNVLEHLERIQEAFDRLAPRRPYKLYSFPEDRNAIITKLLPSDPVPFVDRPEVPDFPAPDRNFVIGPSGSGKSRIITERIRRLPEDAVDHILIPEQRMLDPADAKQLSRESFDGDLLLVWEDIHRVDEAGGNRVVSSTLQELTHALNNQGYELYTLLEARSGRLDNVPGNLLSDFTNDKSLWSDYERLDVGDLDEAHLRDMADTMADRFGVTLDEATRDILVDRTIDTRPAPIYIETALVTADDRLTVDDIEHLAENVKDIWQSQYDALQSEAPEERRVLAAMKFVNDIGGPLYAKLVRAIYLELLDGDRGRFRIAVEGLRNRQWLTINGTDIVALETLYDVHDTQLEAVRVKAKDDAIPLSNLLLEKIDETIPGTRRAKFHVMVADSFQEWGHYSLAKEHFEAGLRLAPDNGIIHHNYAVLLRDELVEPEKAADHFETALDLNSDSATSHQSYAVLLHEELEEPERAAEHFETALGLEPDDSIIHHNYARLLHDELEKPEEAADHFETALELDPANVNAHYSYARLLRDELERPEKAAEHFKTTIRYDSDNVASHHSYAVLLRDELEEPEKAAEHFETTLELDPTNPVIHHNYAVLLRDELEEPGKAANHFENAIQCDSTNVAAHYSYARLLRDELEEPEKAANHFEIALDLDSDDPIIHHSYTKLLATDLDSPEKAATHLETAFDLNPDFIEKLHGPSRDVEDQVQDLYLWGLTSLVNADTDRAIELLSEAWTLRNEVTDNRYTGVAAGVWSMFLPAPSVDSDTVEDSISTFDDSHSTVVSALATAAFTAMSLPAVEELEGAIPYDIEIYAYDKLKNEFP
ncbi:tetratricopeptide repeat protein (plasmid) [Natrialbaceae archaeon A-CW3]